jgi:hypothetical protein
MGICPAHDLLELLARSVRGADLHVGPRGRGVRPTRSRRSRASPWHRTRSRPTLRGRTAPLPAGLPAWQSPWPCRRPATLSEARPGLEPSPRPRQRGRRARILRTGSLRLRHEELRELLDRLAHRCRRHVNLLARVVSDLRGRIGLGQDSVMGRASDYQRFLGATRATVFSPLGRRLQLPIMKLTRLTPKADTSTDASDLRPTPPLARLTRR